VLLKEKNNHRNHWWALIICVALGIGIGVWHNRASRHGKADPLSAAVLTVTSPIIHILVATTNWMNREFGWIIQGPSLSRKYAALRLQNENLQAQIAQLQEDAIDAQRLKSELGFAMSPPLHKIPATILSMRPIPNFQTMVISRGSRDGVKPDSVVVAPLGVVGHVFDVAPTTSSVILLTDPNSAIGAMVQRANSRAVCICKGNGTPLLSIAYLGPNADIRIGDTMISSGLGGAQGVYPKGLVIGTVVSITNDPSTASRQILVKPAVDFDRLEEVYILK
jgi:rod shape-determining protein MreC